MEFDKKQLNRKLFTIAAPIAIQDVVSATLTMVDNIMVGFLGETELAAVGVGSQIFMIHYLVLFGFVSGCATFMAQFYGTRDMASIRKVVGFAFTVLGGFGLACFLAATLFTDSILAVYTDDPDVAELAARYIWINSWSFLMLAFSSPMQMAFKATQQVKIPMIVSAVVFVSNTAVNYILIFGKLGFPAMGVAGAAIGTVTARGFELLINTYCAFRRSNRFRGSIPSYFGWSRELIRRIIKNAAPTTINEFLWSFGQSMYVAAFSRIGITAYAAYQAAFSIYNIFEMAAFSMGDASLILIGERLGKGDKPFAWRLSQHLVNMTIALGLVIGAATILLSKPLSGVFDLTDEGKLYTAYLLIVLGATMPGELFNGVQIAGILRAGGDTRFSMLAESGCVWLIAVPMAFLSALVWHLPIHLALLATRTEMVVKALIFGRRYLSKKWMNTMIEGL